MSEHNEQCNLIDWARKNESVYPALKNLFAIPNGGLRNKRVAIKMKMEGLKAGIPDLFLAYPSLPSDPQDTYWFVDGNMNVMELNSDVYFGLFIEMKYGKNKTTEHQNDLIKRLRSEGYKCIVCYSWEEARDEILEYVNKFAGE